MKHKKYLRNMATFKQRKILKNGEKQLKMNYPPTIMIFRSAIVNAFSDTKIKEGLDNLPSHLLWMLDEIEKFSSSDKASRWIGYVCRCLEDLDIFTNTQIRIIIRNNNKILRFLNRNNNRILRNFLEDIKNE